jgi:hypothetical protein
MTQNNARQLSEESDPIMTQFSTTISGKSKFITEQVRYNNKNNNNNNNNNNLR